MKENPIFIWWKNEPVGQLTNHFNDMGYIDGTWQPNETNLAVDFSAKAAELDALTVLNNCAAGFRIKFSEEPGKEPTIHAYVLTLNNGCLLIKMVSNRDAIELLLSNVPE
jgi:hypothetical protein